MSRVWPWVVLLLVILSALLFGACWHWLDARAKLERVRAQAAPVAVLNTWGQCKGRTYGIVTLPDSWRPGETLRLTTDKAKREERPK